MKQHVNRGPMRRVLPPLVMVASIAALVVPGVGVATSLTNRASTSIRKTCDGPPTPQQLLAKAETRLRALVAQGSTLTPAGAELLAGKDPWASVPGKVVSGMTMRTVILALDPPNGLQPSTSASAPTTTRQTQSARASARSTDYGPVGFGWCDFGSSAVAYWGIAPGWANNVWGLGNYWNFWDTDWYESDWQYCDNHETGCTIGSEISNVSGVQFVKAVLLEEAFGGNRIWGPDGWCDYYMF